MVAGSMRWGEVTRLSAARVWPPMLRSGTARACTAQFMLFACHAVVVLAHLLQHCAQRGCIRGGMDCEARQHALGQPQLQLGLGPGRQQHPAGGDGVGRQEAVQVQAMGQRMRWPLSCTAARYDQHLAAIAHHTRERQPPSAQLVGPALAARGKAAGPWRGSCPRGPAPSTPA